MLIDTHSTFDSIAAAVNYGEFYLTCHRTRTPGPAAIMALLLFAFGYLRFAFPLLCDVR